VDHAARAVAATSSGPAAAKAAAAHGLTPVVALR
jgi:hypothetical protein